MNPMFGLFENFVQHDDLRRMVIDLEAKDLFAPNKVFERAITWLLNLLGFSAIQLQEYETIGKDPEKVSVDIIASYNKQNIVLANVTLSMPNTSNFETERNRRIILSRTVSDKVKLVSIIFTSKSVIQLQKEAKQHEVTIIGREDLEKILELLKTGDVKEARDMILGNNDFGAPI